ncbi:MAG: tetratricopeptide repeat protein [Planctomycetes bacterium]|nr:tetratricopeptide repeat protein [Planctomycetota bacterium]
MTPSTSHKNLIIEDVINALYADGVEGGAVGNLQNQVRRLRVELGKRKASAFTQKLLNSLSENPDELIQLEALVILGFAHPEVARRFHIALATEGRRLGLLLEKAGRPERAREILELLCEYAPTDRTLEIELAGVMRRSGNTEELIERYMDRAHELMAKGQSQEALPWLQEVFALDRTRQDVSHMIRDARHNQHHRITSSRSNRRFALVSLLVLGSMAAVGLRERDLHNLYMEIPAADTSNVTSLAARFDSLTKFQAAYPLWLGKSRVEEELSSLGARQQQLLTEAMDLKKAQARELAEKTAQADNYRRLGLQCSDLGQFSEARVHFENALRVAPEDWPHIADLTRDVQAIRNLEAGQ